jgi:hypothetical protein
MYSGVSSSLLLDLVLVLVVLHGVSIFIHPPPHPTITITITLLYCFVCRYSWWTLEQDLLFRFGKTNTIERGGSGDI